MPETRVDYPGIVAARKPAIPPGLSEQERKAAEDWDSVATLLLWLDGHGQHGGWGFDHGTDCIRCHCGDPLYEVTEVTA